MKTLHAKPTLSRPDLITLLNFELAAYDECSGCRVRSIEPLIVEESFGADPRRQRIIEQVLAETREQFDLGLPS